MLSGTPLIIAGIGLLVVVGLTAILLFSLLAPGASEVVGTPQSMDGRTHITEGTAGGPYSSSPAASGPHWPSPISWGVYTTAIPQEPAIHNLEHGGIVIWYQPTQVSAEQIRQAFLYLPDEQRSALHLVAVEGLSYQEAAAALGIPTGTLMSRLGRARAALRAFEAGQGPLQIATGQRPNLRVVGGSHE